MTVSTPIRLGQEIVTDAKLDELADLSRVEGHVRLRVVYLPNLQEPEEAILVITDAEGNKIDSLTLTVEEGYAAFVHPVWYSAALGEFLRTLDGRN